MDISREANVYSVVMLGTFVILSLVICIVAFLYSYQKRVFKYRREMDSIAIAYQEKLLKENFDALEDERQRISKDLHDDIGTVFSTLSLTIGSLINSQPDPQVINHTMIESQQLIGKGLKNMRNILYDIIPPDIDIFGLSTVVAALCERITASGVLTVRFEESDTAYINFTRKEELMLYRIAQELITNTIKHASAGSASLAFDYTRDHFVMSYSDDGIGFQNEGMHTAGIGLNNIKFRSKILGATCAVNADKRPGMNFRLSVPVKQDIQ